MFSNKLRKGTPKSVCHWLRVIGGSNTDAVLNRILLGGMYLRRLDISSFGRLCYTLSYYICVESVFLPFGAPMTYDRGECCAPFISKTYLKHTLEYLRTHFGAFGNFSFWVKCWLMKRRNPQELTKDS